MAEHAAPVLTKELSLSDDNIRVTSAPLISSAVVPEETETPSSTSVAVTPDATVIC